MSDTEKNFYLEIINGLGKDNLAKDGKLTVFGAIALASIGIGSVSRFIDCICELLGVEKNENI